MPSECATTRSNPHRPRAHAMLTARPIIGPLLNADSSLNRDRTVETSRRPCPRTAPKAQNKSGRKQVECTTPLWPSRYLRSRMTPETGFLRDTCNRSTWMRLDSKSARAESVCSSLRATIRGWTPRRTSCLESVYTPDVGALRRKQGSRRIGFNSSTASDRCYANVVRNLAQHRQI